MSDAMSLSCGSELAPDEHEERRRTIQGFSWQAVVPQMGGSSELWSPPFLQ